MSIWQGTGAGDIQWVTVTSSGNNAWNIAPSGDKKMATYVVEQEDSQGKKARMNIGINVSINGTQATLTESEQEALAKQAAEFLGYKFLGKA